MSIALVNAGTVVVRHFACVELVFANISAPMGFVQLQQRLEHCVIACHQVATLGSIHLAFFPLRVVEKTLVLRFLSLSSNLGQN